MAPSARQFADLLTEGIYRVRLSEGKTIAAIQDELGYHLGRQGGSMIEHWRKGHLPVALADVETLARELVTRGKLEQPWLERFLVSAGHPAVDRLCVELFPLTPIESGPLRQASKPEKRQLDLPLHRVPEPAPLPVGSRMPLSRNPHFVGRHQDLQALAAALKTGQTTAVSQIETAATTGLGGIGKTQLACEFVHRYGQYFTGGVFWLRFANPTAVPAEVAACGGAGALELRPDFGSRPLDEQVRLVQAAWQEPTPRLLVFDNCEDPNLLTQWRPPTGGCRVVVTSRRSSWELVLNVAVLALNVLSREESISLLRRHCPDVALSILDAIAEELGDLPLALHLAGSYLCRYQRAIEPVTYLAQLRDPHLLHHRSLQGHGISPTGHIQHVGRTFALSYDALNPDDEIDALAQQLLLNAALFAPGEPIWYDLLVKTVGLDPANPQDAVRAADSFDRLIVLGLLETTDDHILHMHRLVAVFVRDVAAEQVEAARQAVEAGVFQEAAAINQRGYPMPLLIWQAQIRWVVDVAQMRQDEFCARLCMELGDHLVQVGNYSGARAYFEKALSIREALFGQKHVETAHSLNGLGILLRELGELDEAYHYLTEALHVREGVLGEVHPDTAASLNEIGWLLLLQRKGASARAYFERALTIARKVLGEQHRLTADYANNLGMCLKEALNDLEGALPLLERALAIRRDVLGPAHPLTALSHNNMGYLLQTMRQSVAARHHYEEALAIRRQTLGEQHPDTAQTLNNIGFLLKEIEQWDEALIYLKQALAIYGATVGETHYRTAFCLNNIGTLYLDKGQLDNAQPYLEQALRIRRTVYHTNHPALAESLTSSGRLLQAQGKQAPARILLEQALAMNQALHGDRALQSAQSHYWLVALLCQTGDREEAGRHYQAALLVYTTLFSSDHPQIAQLTEWLKPSD